MRLPLLAIFSLSAFAQLSPLTLPAYDMFRYAVAARPFSYRFAPAGGFAPYSFRLEEGSLLPPGLQLNASTGELSGTVSQVGEYRSTYCISDASAATICVPFLVIAVAADGVTYTEIMPARANIEYQGQVANPGEFAEVSYNPVSGKLPPGMVLEVTGRLYGTPRPPAGAWAFQVQGRDFDGNTVRRAYVIRVLGPLAASVKLPNGYSGAEYSAQLTVLGDKPPYTWTVRRGPLPPGYILSEDGRIAGISNRPDRYLFALRVTDSTGSSEDRELELTVDFALPPLQISNATLPPAALGVAYRQQINVTGGRAPYAFRVLGSVPPGLTLSPAGLLSGTPAAAGTYTFSIQVTDVAGTSSAKTLTVIVGNLRFTGAPATTIFAGEDSRVALSVEGGTPPYRWSLTGGALPAGVSLSEAGVLSGKASATGSTALTLRVTDAAGRTIEIPLAVTVSGPRPVLTSRGIVNGASFVQGGIAPGEIITLFGERMGPPNLAPFTLDGSGKIPGALAGTRVLFGGQPAPLLYVSEGQIGAIVPYSLAGRTTVDVVVDANGVRSEPVQAAVAAAAPGIFALNASGQGPAAALNQDGTLNGAGNPAAEGTVVVLFATGEGQTLPSGADGEVTGAVTSRPSLPVSVTIGGKEAVVAYAGGAPGLVRGVLQVNATVPPGIPPGAAAVVIRVGNALSAPGVTLAIR